MTNLVALPAGTELVGEYRIERVLGAGGFGITYLAVEKSLARRVTIKEYFPVDFAARNAAEDVVPRSQGSEADYKWGLQRFLEEAKTLAKFSHPNIVGVHRCFEARKTGFIVMHYEAGSSFRSWLMKLKRVPRQYELDGIVAKLLDALATIHAADFLHRDIAPDNIIIRPDGSPVLIDFGSARKEVAKHSKKVSALVKPGYSPYEQYATSGKQQGPWTDFYSLAATLYHAMTGKRPLDAPSRMVHDELVPVRTAALSSYRPEFLAAVDQALALDISERPQTVAEWRKRLFAEPKPRSLTGWRASAPRDELPPDGHPAMAEPPAPTHTVADREDVEPQPPKSGRGLISAFQEGWRKAGATPGEIPAVNPDPASPRDVRPASRRKSGPRQGQVSATAAVPPEVSSPPDGAQSARQPARHALRRWRGWQWGALGLKVAAAVGVACAAVVVQNRLMPDLDHAPPIIGSQTALTQSDIAKRRNDGWLAAHGGSVRGLAYLPDAKTLVSLGGDGSVKIWDASTHAQMRSWSIPGAAPTGFAIEGRTVAVGQSDGRITVWDTESWVRSAVLKRGHGAALAMTFVGDQDTLAVVQDNSAALWDLRKADLPPRVLAGHEVAPTAVAYARNRGWLATGAADGTVSLWSKAEATRVRALPPPLVEGPVTAITFSPMGGQLAVASKSGAIRVVLPLSNAKFADFRLHGGGVKALAFSPNGKVLAAAGENGVLQLWDLRHRREIKRQVCPGGAIEAVAWSSDSRAILTGSRDGQIRSWDATLPRSGT